MPCVVLEVVGHLVLRQERALPIAGARAARARGEQQQSPSAPRITTGRIEDHELVAAPQRLADGEPRLPAPDDDGLEVFSGSR
jgi:hypothetical protein